MTITIKSESTVNASPKLVAELFWNMSDIEQVQFFEELHELTTNTKGAYGLGEMQWCHMGLELEKNIKAKEQACAMMVWIFNRATDYLSRNPQSWS